MCHESEGQMEELLKGEPPTLLSKGLNMLAKNQDKNFMSIDKRFKNIDDKLEELLDLLKMDKKDTDRKFQNMENHIQEQVKKRNLDCIEHKKEISEKFDEIEENTELLVFFQKHPKLLIFMGISLIFILGYAFGSEFNIIDLINLLK